MRGTNGPSYLPASGREGLSRRTNSQSALVQVFRNRSKRAMGKRVVDQMLVNFIGQDNHSRMPHNNRPNPFQQLATKDHPCRVMRLQKEKKKKVDAASEWFEGERIVDLVLTVLRMTIRVFLLNLEIKSAKLNPHSLSLSSLRGIGTVFAPAIWI